jgi:hypothetical protein
MRSSNTSTPRCLSYHRTYETSNRSYISTISSQLPDIRQVLQALCSDSLGYLGTDNADPSPVNRYLNHLHRHLQVQSTTSPLSRPLLQFCRPMLVLQSDILHYLLKLETDNSGPFHVGHHLNSFFTDPSVLSSE